MTVGKVLNELQEKKNEQRSLRITNEFPSGDNELEGFHDSFPPFSILEQLIKISHLLYLKHYSNHTLTIKKTAH